jgi:tRNA U55 pseudouridine synthase TruB
MSALRRTRIGEFKIEDAKLWQDVEAEVHALLEG